MPDSKATEFMNNWADFFAHSLRTPILRRPDEYGMICEDVFFPSTDGTALDGWFISADSNKLVICNHAMLAFPKRVCGRQAHAVDPTPLFSLARTPSPRNRG